MQSSSGHVVFWGPDPKTASSASGIRRIPATLSARARFLRSLLAGGAALAIVACGGSGDSSPQPAGGAPSGASPAPSAGGPGDAPPVVLGPPTTDAGTTPPPPAPGDAATGGDTADAAPDAGPVVSSLCTYADGSPIPYDHSRGIVEEFSLELYSSCDLGGYMTPLVNADPVNLTAVTAFNSDLTDWYRARILGCADATSAAPAGDLLLLPASEDADVSRGDFHGVINLYMAILKRHDGQPDGYDEAKKADVRKRLMDLEPTAVKHPSDELSKPSTDPGCTPASPDGG